MNILFCGDGGVCRGIMLSAISLCRNTSVPLDFFILTAGDETHSAVGRDFINRLENAVQKENPENTVRLIDISEDFKNDPPFANLKTRFTPFCMLRLFADKVDCLPERLLYLDTDVLCRGDFSEFYNLDMSGYDIAGVPDRYGKWFFGNVLKHDYLNSGVLLLNMAEIRKSGLFSVCRQLCSEKRMFMPDQTALNKNARKRKADGRYNSQGKMKKDTVFLHFTTFFRFLPYIHPVTVKPWQTEKVHNILKIYEFDNIINDCEERLK